MIASGRSLRVSIPSVLLAAGTGRAGTPITAVIVDSYAGQISLIDTVTGHVFAPVTVGNYPVAVAVSG